MIIARGSEGWNLKPLDLKPCGLGESFEVFKLSAQMLPTWTCGGVIGCCATPQDYRNTNLEFSFQGT